MIVKYLLICILVTGATNGKIHELDLEAETRRATTLTTFGFLQDGIFWANVTKFSFTTEKKPEESENQPEFYFVLARDAKDASWITDGCIDVADDIGKNKDAAPGSQVVYLSINLQRRNLSPAHLTPFLNGTRVGDALKSLIVRETLSRDKSTNKRAAQRPGADALIGDIPALQRNKREEEINPNETAEKSGTEKQTSQKTDPVQKDDAAENMGDETGKTDKDVVPVEDQDPDKDVVPVEDGQTDTHVVPVDDAEKEILEPKPVDPIEFEIHVQKNRSITYSFHFGIEFNSPEEPGLYTLYFLACDKDKLGFVYNLQMEIVERNGDNYLSAGNVPLPILYFTFSCVYFIMGWVWLHVLKTSKDEVYKIHFMMLAVVFLKCASMLFHGINNTVLERHGTHEETWTILYYIAYLMKVTLLLVTVLLIGSGWAFIKHVFSDREKKLFFIFIPIQLLNNIAFIIVEESEESRSDFLAWKEVFIVMDFVCCAIILFPIVWSIQHLQEASHTDGKAALNLNKLKLFRQFYILIVCYIYTTRIIVFLAQVTVPYTCSYLTELFKEGFIFLFFIITGYKFRPVADNPYLQVPHDSEDDEIEMDEVVTKSGVLETVVHLSDRRDKTEDSTTTPNHRESSHDYD